MEICHLSGEEENIPRYCVSQLEKTDWSEKRVLVLEKLRTDSVQNSLKVPQAAHPVNRYFPLVTMMFAEEQGQETRKKIYVENDERSPGLRCLRFKQLQ